MAIEVHNPQALARGLQAGFNKQHIAPGESAQLHIAFRLENRVGKAGVVVPFETTEDGKTEHYRVPLEGYVDSIFDELRPGLEMGIEDAASPVEKSIHLTSSTFPEFRIARVVQSPDFLRVRIANDRQTLLLTPVKVMCSAQQRASHS